ncbi:MAG: hypothetical protein FWB90_04720 [Fibromonadales bacterium]|nr:hypothetical protein [Fibromonadales bacterium]
MRIVIVLVLAFLLASCSQKPAAGFTTPPPNLNAPLAFFGVGNMKLDMQREYAIALQNAGLYNFITENISEEQVENAIEIRLNFVEEKEIHFNSVPAQVIKAEFRKKDLVWFNLIIREKSDQINFSDPRRKANEKKRLQKALLERFVGEVKRMSASSEPAKSCKG